MNSRRTATISTMAIIAFAATVAMADGATVNVKVNWEGKAYKAKPMRNMNKECVGFHAPSGSALLDQHGCIYVPRVLGVMVGQTLEIRNSDPTAHNVHFTPKKNKEFNKSQPKKDLVEKLTFKRSEMMVPVKCDVHPWMGAFVGVMDNPFFGTTRGDGTVQIEGLPGGTYTLVAWHEKFGEKTTEITVSTDGSADAEFTFSRADKKRRK